MKIIKRANELVSNLLGIQCIEHDVKYVKSKYLIEDNNVIYNTITGEAILTSDQNADKNYLISHWFYVPQNLDIYAFSHLLRQKRINASKGPGSYNKSLYVIFTTTACNASCSYCFEKEYDIYTMTEAIASDVADYIEKTANRTREIKIKWFGGEPLCNKKAINIICKKLDEKKIRFSSIMTTNGSLLDECTDEEIVDIWKLKSVQLTFDDLDEEYEKIKKLPAGSFDKLVKNMVRLENLNIHIDLRIHYNPVKGKEVCFKIADRFKNFSNVHMYARLVYDNMSEKYFKELIEVDDHLVKLRKGNKSLPNPISTVHCMADSPRLIGITPDGGLTPCEHFAYGENVFGTIYEKEVDEEIIKTWSARYKFTDSKCKDCPLYPSCRKLVMCPAEGKCSEGYQYYQIETIKRALRKKVEEINGDKGH